MVKSSPKPTHAFYLAFKHTELPTLAWMWAMPTRNKVILSILQGDQKSILKNLDRQSCSFAKLVDRRVVGLGLSDP